MEKEKQEDDIITKILAKIDKDGSIPDLLAFAKYVTFTLLMTTRGKNTTTPANLFLDHG